jgi:hypothetical protein
MMGAVDVGRDGGLYVAQCTDILVGVFSHEHLFCDLLA